MIGKERARRVVDTRPESCGGHARRVKISGARDGRPGRDGEMDERAEGGTECCASE